MSHRFEIQGKAPADGGSVVPEPRVSHGYFRTLLRGRIFDGHDSPASPPVTITCEDLFTDISR